MRNIIKKYWDILTYEKRLQELEDRYLNLSNIDDNTLYLNSYQKIKEFGQDMGMRINDAYFQIDNPRNNYYSLKLAVEKHAKLRKDRIIRVIWYLVVILFIIIIVFSFMREWTIYSLKPSAS